MKYTNIMIGKFISRPNRFIAYVEIDGKEEMCHVKNTGRCKELLLPGVKVVVQKCDNPERKTKFDLICVYKKERIINIDSQAPNKVFEEWVTNCGFFGEIKYIKPECKYKKSRFDFYIETDNKKIFVEVKGVTLEEDNIVKFPDAPTERGVKHINELSECISEGYEAYIFFVVQMLDVDCFIPNRETHPEFADALLLAEKNGVNVKCVDCMVSESELRINNFIDTNIEALPPITP